MVSAKLSTSKNKKREPEFFKDDIRVESYTSSSTQATIFFGREVYTGIKVVLKQYTKNMLKGMLREIKIHTLLENVRVQLAGEDQEQNLSKNIKRGSKHDGLPQMLCYRINKNIGEILMVNDGENLATWS